MSEAEIRWEAGAVVPHRQHAVRTWCEVGTDLNDSTFSIGERVLQGIGDELLEDKATGYGLVPGEENLLGIHL